MLIPTPEGKTRTHQSFKHSAKPCMAELKQLMNADIILKVLILIR